MLKNKEDLEYLVAEVSGIEPGKPFTALVDKKRSKVLSTGNTVLMPGLQLHTPMTISWQLGKDPKPGSAGRIHVVSPAKSLCVAEQGPAPGEPVDSSDFPARISYSISYDIFINNQRLVHDQAGIAVAYGVDRIPPRDVLVAFDKPVLADIWDKLIDIINGTCTGMVEISEKDFRKGCEIAKYYRSARLDVKSGERPKPPPF